MATILIVDDRPTNREFLVSLLGYGDNRLLEASDGAEALARVRAERPDLVLADILMPTMDGYEFVRQLRADSTIARTPVIFITAHYHRDEAQALARACGVSCVLTKPCEPEAVLAAVQAALDPTPGPAPPPPPIEFDREHLRLLTDELSEKSNALRKANERLSALIELSLQLGSERNPSRLIHSFCHSAREIVGARYAIAAICGDDDKQLRYLFTSGMDAEKAARLGSPHSRQGPLEKLLSENRPIRLQNPSGDPTAIGFSAAHPPIHSWLGAPIVSPSGVYGWLSLIDKIGVDAFSEDDERVAQILTGQVGRIYENGSMYSSMQQHADQLECEVAERQRANLALEASERRYRTLFEHNPEPMWVYDPNNLAFLAVNDAAITHYGYSRDEFLAMTIKDIRPPEDVPKLLERLAGGLEDLDHSVRWRHRKKDGSVIEVEAASHALDFGNINARLVLATDVTERNKAEAARDRLIAILEGTPDLIAMSTVDGPTSYINPAGRRLLELDPLEKVSLLDQRPENGRTLMVDVAIPAAIASGAWSGETALLTKSGKEIPVSQVLIAHKNAAGTVEFLSIIARDISERMLLEEQFRQSQKMEAIGRLAGGIAHDFNNLLTIINGYSSMMLETALSGDPHREFIEQVKAAGDRAASLTRQLLIFSRKQLVQPVLLGLNGLLADMGKLIRRLIGEDIDLQVVTEPRLWNIRADIGQMEQVLMNLVVNARDAMPRGGKLTIETRNVTIDEFYVRHAHEEHRGPHVLLAVSDTGCGMDAATQQRIFEPFFTTKGPEKGTGLGLATVFGIVKQGGGHIGVYSEPGHGTSFEIYFPAITEMQKPLIRSSSKSSPGFRLTLRGTETVLLVEDENGVRALARLALQRQGYNVLEARSGAEALAIAARHPGDIQLLVTDIVMPQMSGPQVAERLAPLRPKMKILYLSGYLDDALVHHGTLAAEVPFLQKPYAPSVLAQKVRDILDG